MKRMPATILLISFVLLGTPILLSQGTAPNQASVSEKVIRHPTHYLKKSVAFMTVEYLVGDSVRKASGTCFFVAWEDERLGKDKGFTYLVTNRHVAQPTAAAPVTLLRTIIRLNKKSATSGSALIEMSIPAAQIKWHVSPDPSVDLAVTPVRINPDLHDIYVIPSSIFMTKDKVPQDAVSEGDSLLFTGMFYQFPGSRKNHPIVRHGILAMIPEEKMLTTLGSEGWLYLAEIHAFHGNSGSPVFIDLGGQRATGLMAGIDYRLLGVLSGYVIEDQEFRVRVSTTLTGEVNANSDVATVVPVDELISIIKLPELQRLRDEHVARNPVEQPSP